MEKVSAIITCFNRESVIETCLKSVRWVDELIVIDSFSTDRTVARARKYADQLLEHEYISAARQRNWALRYATHPWILIIDSDEVMPEELTGEIKETLKAPRYQRYKVYRRGFFLGRELKHGGWNRDTNNILFRKDRYRFNDDEVHPLLIPEGEFGIFTNRLLHYTHRSIDEFITKANIYATWGARKYFRQGRRCAISRMLIHMVYNFIRNYIVRRGFLDGARGLIVAILSSYYIAEKYAKLWELQHQEKDTRESGKSGPA